MVEVRVEVFCERDKIMIFDLAYFGITIDYCPEQAKEQFVVHRGEAYVKKFMHTWMWYERTMAPDVVRISKEDFEEIKYNFLDQDRLRQNDLWGILRAVFPNQVRLFGR